MHARRKRAAPKDIYPSCKISNNCPDDIRNKIEHNTLADKILKWGSAGVFFGSLGIGTGRGTGSYVPLGSGVNVGTRVSTVKPSIPISSVGTADVIPVDAMNPLGPALAPPKFPTAVEDPVIIRPPKFPSIVEDPVIVHSAAEHPAVLDPDHIAVVDISGETVQEIPYTTSNVVTEEQPAVLDVSTETRAPKIISRTQYENPSFEVAITSNATAGETSATDHILVDGYSGGQHIGEQIELQELARRSFSTTIEEETSFLTSTPNEAVVRPKTRNLNSRRYLQTQVTDPAFVTQPRSLVTFQNPAFDESVDLIFEKDVADFPLAAPNEDFRDLISLSKPIYHRSNENTVRVSRFGTKASVKTRSGVIAGPQIHYFYDLSEIAPADNIELATLGSSPVGEQSGESVISSGTTDMEIISLTGSTLESYSDESLLDIYEPIANDLQLVIGIGRRVRPISVPDLLTTKFQIFPGFEGVHVHTSSSNETPKIPINPLETPAVVIDLLGGTDFYLHPALFKKKKKRLFCDFFADGGVASCTE
ncbi:L2 protein [Crocuta crocuta papillomavirus 1]|uniref:Minor capsid protein L2 n=1 Tax=Crocuta crocuta papillomavirus 1 TaxID=1104917 RepID=J7F291_9PAPI|nr:L2 protein [Crocuta crocuta papillomavirus 1]AER38252.1 L2 protein [Crocuta crocuta papillomavirus 1]